MKKIRAIALFCIAGLLPFASEPVMAAGINCTKAKTNTEKLICGDDELGALDTALAKVYEKTRLSSGDSDEVDEVERNWLNTVRDKCGTVDCLKTAYHARIRQLARNFVSFDCEKATTRTELSICGDDRLQYADMQLAQTFRTLKGATNHPEKLVSDQKTWLKLMRDNCDSADCLLSVINQRNTALQQQWASLIEFTSKKIGYTEHAFYSDMMTWPKDASRTIVLFASQASAGTGSDAEVKQDEDFDIDLYVIDSASHKVLQHGTDTFTSDAITLEGLGLDRTDYASQLYAPVFGISTYHSHHGCAGYSKNSIRLYTISGKSIANILPEIATNTANGMCMSNCDYGSSRRELQFSNPLKHPYPDLLIHEKRKAAEDNPKGPEAACKITASQKEYKLHFDGGQYAVPQGLDY